MNTSNAIMRTVYVTALLCLAKFIDQSAGRLGSVESHAFVSSMCIILCVGISINLVLCIYLYMYKYNFLYV